MAYGCQIMCNDVPSSAIVQVQCGDLDVDARVEAKITEFCAFIEKRTQEIAQVAALLDVLSMRAVLQTCCRCNVSCMLQLCLHWLSAQSLNLQLLRWCIMVHMHG